MAEFVICLMVFLFFWSVMRHDVLDSWTDTQKAWHEIKEARLKHKTKIEQLKGDIKAIKEDLKKL